MQESINGCKSCLRVLQCKPTKQAKHISRVMRVKLCHFRYVYLKHQYMSSVFHLLDLHVLDVLELNRTLRNKIKLIKNCTATETN